MVPADDVDTRYRRNIKLRDGREIIKQRSTERCLKEVFSIKEHGFPVLCGVSVSPRINPRVEQYTEPSPLRPTSTFTRTHTHAGRKQQIKQGTVQWARHRLSTHKRANAQHQEHHSLQAQRGEAGRTQTHTC